jgi:glyoxylase-like metal-dependent hydrolase (beta-lactamase superfamily II)
LIRERVAEDVYVFTSEVYARVNAGAIVGPDWAVVIDTLAYPEESQEIREFIEERLELPIRYLINTHHHADHSLGNCWFPNAILLSHELCRDLLDTKGREALEVAKQNNRELADIDIVLPDVTFKEGEIEVRVGKRTLRLMHLPGHSVDGIGVLVVEERVLFSGDIMMPVPYILDGDMDVMAETMKSIPKIKLENLVQGHGEVILRGEVQHMVKDNLNYLATITKHAKKALRRRAPEEYLATVDVESCGKNRILLNGLAEELHRRNLLSLYQKLKEEKEG